MPNIYKHIKIQRLRCRSLRSPAERKFAVILRNHNIRFGLTWQANVRHTRDIMLMFIFKNCYRVFLNGGSPFVFRLRSFYRM